MMRTPRALLYAVWKATPKGPLFILLFVFVALFAGERIWHQAYKNQSFERFDASYAALQLGEPQKQERLFDCPRSHHGFRIPHRNCYVNTRFVVQKDYVAVRAAIEREHWRLEQSFDWPHKSAAYTSPDMCLSVEASLASVPQGGQSVLTISTSKTCIEAKNLY